MSALNFNLRITTLSTLTAFLVLVSPVAFAAPPQVENGFTFAAGGDLLGPYQTIGPKDDPPQQAVADHFRNADLGFANMEGSIFDISGFKGWPAAETGGGYPLMSVAVGKELRAFGITVVSKANNHATDWGTEGLVATLDSLKQVGIAEAGAGMNLAEACAPVYLQTSKGVAALVDTASTFTPMSVAGPEAHYGRFYQGGRPGICPLHVREVHLLPFAQFDKLHNLIGGVMEIASRRQAWSGEPVDAPMAQGADLVVGNTVFRGAEKPGVTWEMRSKDVETIIDSIKQARRHANFVLFSIHAHEITPFANPSQGNNLETARPTDFERTLFHKAIDAGADAVVRNGPHVIGGIEIYKGKPIFYSIGSLFNSWQGWLYKRTFQMPSGSLSNSPGGGLISFPEAEFQTFVPVTTYKNGQVSVVRIYPVVIESSKSRIDGRPRPASPVEGREILERLKSLSARYGTKMKIENNIGLILGPGK